MDKIKKLQEYDDLYYNEGTSPISDSEYDKIKEDAKKENPGHPYFQRVGSDKFKTGKVKLPYVLGSLEKVKPETVIDFLRKIKGPKILMEKLDGVSIYVEYLDGQVTFAALRGDGYKGKDITKKAKMFCPHINIHGKIVLRGEAMLMNEIYKELGFKTRRNGAAGILNRDDGKYCKYLAPVFYEIIESDIDFKNEAQKLNFINNWISMTPNYHILYEDNVGEILDFLDSCKKGTQYEIDGLVISPLNYEREDVLYPSNKVAFKVNKDPVEANVRNVEWKITRTGRIVPVVIVEPVDFEGVTVTKATGFNYEFIVSNDIGKGSVIDLVRSGDVIPYITGIKKRSEKGCNIPIECPSCGNALFVRGVDLICNNDICDVSAYYKVEYFLRTLGAENISYKTLMKLGLNTIEDCYEIDEWEISSIEGFGVKRGEQIIGEIQSTLQTSPEKLLAAFGIPNISLITAQSIINKIGSLEKVFDSDASKFERIEGIGEKTAKYLVDHLPKYVKLYEFLKENGLTFEDRGDKLKEKIFCLTGKGPMGRQNLINAIEGEGGLVKGMSKSVDYLVCANKDSNSGKAKKAHKYGTKIITYDELMEMINE